MGRAVRPQRRSIRLPSYDYAGDGWYFITICTRDKTCWLGSIVDSSMLRSAGGRVVQSIWESLPRRFPGVTLDAFVVMPNHVHGILVLESQTGAGTMGAGAVGAGAVGAGAMNRAPTLGGIVRAFKAVSTRLIRAGGLDEFAWQRNHYEHIIRSERSLAYIRRYVEDNPVEWAEDRFYAM